MFLMVLVFFGILVVSAHAWVHDSLAYGVALFVLALMQGKGLLVYSAKMKRAERDKMSLVYGEAKAIGALRQEQETQYYRDVARERAKRGGV